MSCGHVRGHRSNWIREARSLTASSGKVNHGFDLSHYAGNKVLITDVTCYKLNCCRYALTQSIEVGVVTKADAGKLTG
jgi:hypothetical protein